MTTRDETRHRGRILLVDDQAGFLEQAAFFLEMEGYEVECARDGVEALSVLERFLPDLILADVMMPRMNGFELRKRIRESQRLSDVRFVFVSARDRSLDPEETRHLEAADYVAKPFDPDHLLGVIERKLGLDHDPYA